VPVTIGEQFVGLRYRNARTTVGLEQPLKSLLLGTARSAAELFVDMFADAVLRVRGAA
jgi:hypothetical protein